ncbi:hypothetical protein [Fibrella aquatilis]|uniref:Uncharacterized protein n=1 Tax=Fibrella aquatilis TaxID=2817059 RepID=A0A939GAN7_9BACT|nr:hypothetical protein [Fibrella aquatilis]MBO0934318.1 hypothetical protein [Fibrella aquatilis]
MTSIDGSHIRRSIVARWSPSARWSSEVGIDFIQTPQPTINYSFPVAGSRILFLDRPGRRPQYTVRQYYTPINFRINRSLGVAAGLYAGGAFSTHKTNSSGGSIRDFSAFAPDLVRGQTETISSVATSTYPNRTTFSTEIGFHLNGMLGERWQIRYQGGWHQGFGTTIRTNVEYVSSFAPGVTNRAVITSNGSGWSGGISVAYLFGRRALDNVSGGSFSDRVASPPKNHRFSIGLDGGSRAYQFTYADPGGRLLNEPTQLRESIGISARWYASERWTTEVGFQRSIFNAKDVNFTFPNPERISASVDLEQTERHWYVRQYYNALIARPFKGVSVAVGPHVGIGLSQFRPEVYEFSPTTTPGGGPNNEPEVITSQFTLTFPQAEAWIAEAGLNAHFMLGNRVHLRYQLGRMMGFTPTTVVGVNYQSSLNPAMNAATIITQGTGWLNSGMIAYRFGRANPPSQRRVREK